MFLKRDFGIKQSRAKELAQHEVFSFSQNRPVQKYLDMKVTYLKIAGILSDCQQCEEVICGLKDREYLSAIGLDFHGKTMEWLRFRLGRSGPIYNCLLGGLHKPS